MYLKMLLMLSNTSDKLAISIEKITGQRPSCDCPSKSLSSYVTLKNRSWSPMLELDLDLVQMNVHTIFGDHRSIY